MAELSRSWCADGGSSFRGGARGAGTFQKTSVDEAYLEPTRRTLAAELYKSNDKERRTPAAQLILSGDDKERTGNRTLLCSPALAKRAVLRGLSAPAEKAAERGLSDKEHTDNRTVLCSPPAKKTAVDASSGCALICGVRDFGDEEMEASEGGDSLGGGGGGGENAMGVAVAVDGFPDDGRRKEAGGERRGVAALERHSRAGEQEVEEEEDGEGEEEEDEEEKEEEEKEEDEDEEGGGEEEEDRLLRAGLLLGRRIQRTLSEVLKYDCSVGVSRSKVRYRGFLAL